MRAAVAACLHAIGPGLYGVACSGGADSLALADAAIEVAGAAHVAVMTIDHGLAAGSAARADAVAAWARDRGAAGLVRRVAVARAGQGLEAAARDARYAALGALADEVGACAILTAHTARDQAETVAMRILRGTGIAGLAGIPRRRGRVHRPLLALPRAAIDAYVAARGLAPWHDPMNDDPALTRVRVRRDVLPALRRENPNLDAALLRLAAAAAEHAEAIDSRAAGFGLPVDCVALAREPAAVRKRALAIAFPTAEAAHLDQLDDLVTAPRRGTRSLDLPADRAVRTYDTLDRPRATPPPDDLPQIAGTIVRAWRPGDRIRTRAGSRKLSDLYIDLRIPRDHRAALRVVIRPADQVIIWAERIGAAAVEPA
nr:tRNA lysidine(34) synthetase TilS [Kofleriaceae bacterium]